MAALFPRILLVLLCPFAAAGPVERIDWQDDLLTLRAPAIPGGAVEIWYLEAFCRSGSTDRDWHETTIPHQTRLVEADAAGQWIRLESRVEPGVRVTHEIRVVPDGVSFDLVLTNMAGAPVDVAWAQPCMRVGGFTGLDQERYPERCFIFTEDGQESLDQTEQTREARYPGGQVYVPNGIDHADVNPRPISPEVPVKHLIRAVSADNKWVLAMAWDQTQELFQGVIVCIHSDFGIGGLAAGEEKRVRGRVYLMPNDPGSLLSAYERDFELPEAAVVPR